MICPHPQGMDSVTRIYFPWIKYEAFPVQHASQTRFGLMKNAGNLSGGLSMDGIFWLSDVLAECAIFNENRRGFYSTLDSWS